MSSSHFLLLRIMPIGVALERFSNSSGWPYRYAREIFFLSSFHFPIRSAKNRIRVTFILEPSSIKDLQSSGEDRFFLSFYVLQITFSCFLFLVFLPLLRIEPPIEPEVQFLPKFPAHPRHSWMPAPTQPSIPNPQSKIYNLQSTIPNFPPAFSCILFTPFDPRLSTFALRLTNYASRLTNHE